MTIGLRVEVEIDLVGLTRRRVRQEGPRPDAGRNLGWGRGRQRVRRRSSRLMRVRPGGAQAHAVGGGEVEDR
jgi:hypothetical protein